MLQDVWSGTIFLSLTRVSREVVCKYNQTGFCKFDENCQNRYFNENCENLNDCREYECTKRHPKMCKHFANHGKCRFKDVCAYKHKEPVKKTEWNQWSCGKNHCQT